MVKIHIMQVEIGNSLFLSFMANGGRQKTIIGFPCPALYPELYQWIMILYILPRN